MEITFVSGIKNCDRGSNGPYTVHLHSEYSSVFVGYETDNIIEELFNSLLGISKKFKNKDKKSNHVFDSVDGLYYTFHKISLNRGGSYMDSPEWLKNKKATINLKNKKDDKCFQYAIAVTLNHQQTNNHPEEI